MVLDISPIGWAIILFIYVLAAVALALVWLRTRVIARALVLLAIPIVIALPIADEAWIGWHFREACKDAGVHVARKVVVDGFLDDTSRSVSSSSARVGLISSADALKAFDDAGFRFQEQSTRDGKVWHLERVADGLQASVLDKPEARYHYKYSSPSQEVPIGLKLEKRETIVVDAQGGAVIAREIRYNRYPGWVESLWVRLLGSGLKQCEGVAPKPPELRTVLYRYALIPAAAKR